MSVRTQTTFGVPPAHPAFALLLDALSGATLHSRQVCKLVCAATSPSTAPLRIKGCMLPTRIGRALRLLGYGSLGSRGSSAAPALGVGRVDTLIYLRAAVTLINSTLYSLQQSTNCFTSLFLFLFLFSFRLIQ
ncbi:hypothetical protein GDO78_015719 [Eleutherodactylus coqui]|uniref:Uncharacterized protein n=1 Tax=Eleutherodactylus coqui TaxID=57060 RepID=A0A8J6JNV5_ELECQ|nr:hypothetical protein GDO78_015719 [Eleutherodactylus coqui]